MPSSTVSMSSSCSSVPVHDQPVQETGSFTDVLPFTVVEPKRRRKPNQFKPQPLSKPSDSSHTLLFRPQGAGNLQRADFPVLLRILHALGALLPARWIRGGGLAVDFATEENLQSASSITALAGVKVRADKPVTFSCRSGVIGGVPPELSPSAFLEEVAAGNPDVKLHRAQRLGNPANSWAMKVVFVGSFLPTNILFRFRSHPVRPFQRKQATVNPPAAITKPPPASQQPKSYAAAIRRAVKELTVRAALEPEEPPRSTKPAPPFLTEAVTQTDEVGLLVPQQQEEPEQPSCSDAANQTEAVEVPATQEPRKSSQHSRATSPMQQKPQKCYECYSHLQPTPIYEVILGEAYLRGKNSQGWKADLAYLLQYCTRLAAAPADVNQLTIAAGQDPKFQPKPLKGKGKR